MKQENVYKKTQVYVIDVRIRDNKIKTHKSDLTADRNLVQIRSLNRYLRGSLDLSLLKNLIGYKFSLTLFC